MSPAFDPRPWGTLDLSAIYPNAKFNERIGEAWLTGDDCVVTNGPLAKRSLADLSKEFGAELVGTAARDPERFPLLLKFLFPEQHLSVQVHPDDKTAQGFGEPWGKTECWYVAHAKPGAKIALGLKPGVTTAQFEQSVQQNRKLRFRVADVSLPSGDLLPQPPDRLLGRLRPKRLARLRAGGQNSTRA